MVLSSELRCFIWLILFCSAFLFSSGNLYSQSIPDSLQTAPPDSLSEAQLQEATRDTIPPDLQSTPSEISGGSTNIPQSAQNRQSDRQATPDAVNFQAQDSLTFNFRGQRTAQLFGSGNVRHESGQLTAGKIELDLNKNIVQANTTTPEDTLSYPVLKQGDRDLRSTRILFNYETEKGKFEVAEIEVDDGYLVGTKVKNVSRNEVFVEDGIYSTCPPDHMYYYIQAKKMKVVDEEEIFFTNARLFILDIPYPLIFPFGYVPAGIEQKQSGLLEPTYMFQNTSTRGIGLQNLGWFQYINDHLTAQTSFDVFTSGTFFNESRLQYRKTGQYNGSILVGYSNERGLEPTDPNFSKTVTKRLSLSHDQQLSPYSNINASINLRTANYFQQNSFDLDERAETSTTSRISYRYSQPEGAYNFSVNSNLNQNFNNNTTRLTGPDMTFSLRQFSPFKSSSSGTDEKFYERITIRYDNSFKSNFNFTPIDRDSAEVNWFEALFDPEKYREATGNDRHIEFGFNQSAHQRER